MFFRIDPQDGKRVVICLYDVLATEGEIPTSEPGQNSPPGNRLVNAPQVLDLASLSPSLVQEIDPERYPALSQIQALLPDALIEILAENQGEGSGGKWQN